MLFLLIIIKSCFGFYKTSLQTISYLAPQIYEKNYTSRNVYTIFVIHKNQTLRYEAINNPTKAMAALSISIS